MKKTKIYSVTFLEYTNCMRDTVSDWDGKSENIGKNKYLDIGKETFLIREDELLYFKQFGGGFKDVHFVGYLGEMDRIENLEYTHKKCECDCTEVTPCGCDKNVFVEKIDVGDGGFQYGGSTRTPLKDYNTITCADFHNDETTTSVFNYNEENKTEGTD